MTTLKLVISKAPFEVMKTGEKLEEYRSCSAWMKSRLFDKSGNKRIYDFIQFTNGYGKDRPSFTAKFIDVVIENNIEKEYSTGFKLKIIDTPTYVIKFSLD